MNFSEFLEGLARMAIKITPNILVFNKDLIEDP